MSRRRRSCFLAGIVPESALAGVLGTLGVFGISALGAPAFAQQPLKIEGEYTIQLDARKTDRFFPWDYDFNNDDSFGLAQLKFFAQPRQQVEAFVRLEADWNRANNNNPRPELQYRESHLRFGWDKQGKGINAWIFSRQDRFWVENHLIQVIQGDRVKDGDNGQGIRLDAYNWLGGTDFNYVYSDFSGQANPNTSPDPTNPTGTDDAHIFRARREFLDKAVRAGLTYGRKVESEDRLNEQGHAEVLHGDVRLQRGTLALSVEYAQTNRVGLDLEPADDDDWVPSDATLRAELRSITVGRPTWGYLNIAPTYWNAGPNYDNPLGDALNDEQGFFINTWYLIPARAITLTTNYGEWERKVFEQKEFTELYVELYTEYVNGFTSKFFYRRKRTEDFANPLFVQEFKNDDVFVELQVESRLAWLRVQGKLKDLDTEFQKELASLETSINLTQDLKIYNRFTFGNDPARLRDSFFAELQYRPRPGMEAFLSYGPWWIGDSNNPVDDGDLEGGAENKDIIRFTLRGYF